ncbi:alanine racemase [Tersicoccus solisilvae]|uniref:Alanine racemase n=1 Tax=Tersicoccus solisilvae TaxID=1882339 RepID=A0ABQ1PFS0_9MICC|nr:amino acid deaminase [Tersicoccus solisilvae]GGC96318.1 alanine racemase [Tersicoccus solisilvae]
MADASGTRPAIDAAAVDGLRTEVLDWRHQAVPASRHGLTAEAFASGGSALADLQTPLLTLDSGALTHNLDLLAGWCRDRGVLLAPHGKTTMAPALWRAQLDRGAWGITLANPAQLRVGRHVGVQTLMLANSLTDPQAIRWVAGEVASGARIVSWVDDVRTVERIDAVLGAAGIANDGADVELELIVELGGAGGRTGARSVEAALEVARAVGASRHGRLAGVGGYEGSLAHTADDAGLAAVRQYLTALRSLHERLLAEGAYPGDALVTAGGSAYFDDVVGILGPCATGRGSSGGAAGPRVDVVLRSGAYVIHDDGFYRGISPFSRQGPARHDPDGEDAFRSAMHVWARVVSAPEPGLAILDAGKRDLPVDEGLPVPQLIGPELGAPMRPLTGARITAVNDQHCYLVTDPDTTDGIELRPGDVVRLGLSHPCTAMDKWTLVPVIDDADRPEDAVVVDTVRTFF